jgi:hypothetical protein
VTTKSRRSDLRAAAKAPSDQGANGTLSPVRELQWVKQLPSRLKGYAEWMKQFLHGRK